MLPNTRFGIHDNATEVINAQTFPNPGLRWERDAGHHLGKALNHKAKRLCGDAMLVTPAKDAIDKKGLEPL
jgi:hypothetical protein